MLSWKWHFPGCIIREMANLQSETRIQIPILTASSPFFFFSFLLVIIGNRKRHLVSASIKVKSVLGCFWFGFQGFGYHLVFCVWGPIDRTLLLTNILLQPCWVMANSPSNKLKHFLGAHNYVLGDTRKIFFNFLQKLLALPLYHT